MKKAIMILIAVLALALIISCNPDQLASTGKFLEGLSDAGLVSRNTKYVDAATEMVKSFIAESEVAFYWLGGEPSASDFSKDPELTDPQLSFVSGTGEADYLSVVNRTMDKLLAARDSSAKDEGLRNVLNSKYVGKTSRAYAFKCMGTGMRKDVNLKAILGGPNSNQMSLLAMMIGKEAAGSITDMMDTTILPLPVQSYDYNLLVYVALTKATSILDVTTRNKPSGDPLTFDGKVLKRFQEDIGKAVGERDYQTVGDKIAVGLVYNAVKIVCDIDTHYRSSSAYTDAEEGHKYDGFGKHVMTNESDNLDKLLGCLDAIGYIYGVKLDVAGLVAGLV